MRKNKVTTIQGHGRLTGPVKNGLVDIELTGNDGKKSKVQAKNVILATGSEARMLAGLKPDPTILTNIEILSLNSIPKSLIVIGSGAVGVEFASIYRSYGTEVHVIEALPRLVPVEDEDVSKELLRVYKKRGINCYLGAKVEKVEKTKTGASVTFTSSDAKKQTLEAEKVLIAIGRAPQTENVGLEKTRIKAERGFIATNEWMQTVEPCIYAIGDIILGMPQLAHVAAMQGMVAVAKIAGQYARPVRRNLIPGCTYCEPQIGSVGLTEAQAREKGYKVKIGKFPFSANSKASIISNHEGFIKVVSEERYGEIMGVHIIGPSATELISEAVTAMQLEATVEEMMFTIHAHPTLYEALLDGFSSVEGKAINI
jgi:dihydrolipoamide dehydrogenase